VATAQILNSAASSGDRPRAMAKSPSRAAIAPADRHRRCIARPRNGDARWWQDRTCPPRGRIFAGLAGDELACRQVDTRRVAWRWRWP
jgi:hypothetical protein